MKVLKFVMIIILVKVVLLFSKFPGNCLEFHGWDGYVEFTDSLTLSGDYTIEVWVKTLVEEFGDKNSKEGEMYVFSGSVADEQGILIDIKSNGTCSFLHRNPTGPSGGSEIISSVAINDGEWHHIAGVKNGSTLTMYVDGVSQGFDTGITGFSNSMDIFLGKLNSAVTEGDEFYEGRIDEMRIWNIARTEIEINNNMYNELIGTETGLVNYYRFDETDGDILPDITSTNDGLLENMWDEWHISTIILPDDSTYVAFAGSEIANGLYTIVDFYDNQPVYSNGNCQLVYMGEVWKGSANPKYESAAWNIFDGTIDDNDVLYSVEEDPDSVDFTPVAEGWEVDWDGIAPAPIVYFGEVVICDKLIFNETSVNSGEIDNTSSALIKHNNFKGACFSGVDNEDFYANSKIQLTNIPSGLTPSIIRIDSVTLNFTFNGTASSHENADDAVMTLSYSNSAFTSGDVSAIKNNTSDIILNFCQEYSVAPSGGDFTTISGAVNAEGYIYGIGDVINVAAGTYIETSELLIEKGITIQGAGFENTIVQVNEPGVSQYKLFNILKDWERDDDFEVVIKGLTIKGGDISTLGYNSEAYGGSIYAGEVGLYLYNAVVENSRAWSGGGIYTEGANVLLENVTVRNNSSVWDGGGVYLNYTDENCVAKVINSTIYGNNTDASGGGIVARDSTEITNSTIIDNVASDDAGGIRCESSSKVLITNSTVLGNSAGDEGGGFWTNFGEITISNTIITDNYANSANSDYHREYGSYLTDNGYNCIGYQISVGTDNFTHPENILFNLKADSTASAEWTRNNIALTNQTVGLDTLLADNDTNNNTQTIALLDGSFLIDAGNDQANGTVDIPAQDQRGFNRNGNVDIGAYEFMSLYYPQNVLTAINGDDFELSWSPVVGATGYKVYSSDDPYSGFVEEAIAPTGETWSIEASESKKFYYVVAVDGAKVSTKKIKAKDSNSESR